MTFGAFISAWSDMATEDWTADEWTGPVSLSSPGTLLCYLNNICVHFSPQLDDTKVFTASSTNDAKVFNNTESSNLFDSHAMDSFPPRSMANSSPRAGAYEDSAYGRSPQQHGMSSLGQNALSSQGGLASLGSSGSMPVGQR